MDSKRNEQLYRKPGSRIATEEEIDRVNRLINENNNQIGLTSAHAGTGPGHKFSRDNDERNGIESSCPAIRRQVGGDHYKDHAIQPWDIIDEYELNYYEGNVLKYLLRCKGERLEELRKSQHYLEKEIENHIARHSNDY